MEDVCDTKKEITSFESGTHIDTGAIEKLITEKRI